MTDTRRTGLFRELHAAVVPVSDLAKARAWYEGVLGLEPRRVEGTFLAVYGTAGPTHLCLYVPAPGTERPGYDDQGAFPNWRADDIEATRERLVEKGVPCTPIRGGGGVSFFTFRDPDGNRHDVCAFGPDWLP